MVSSVNNTRFAFWVITSIFFLWGFTTVSNDILVPYLKDKFGLSDSESMFVNLAFFGAYGVCAFLYFLRSKIKGDPINELGYKNGIVAGLIVSAFACFLFFPMSYVNNYYLFLIPLVFLGAGFTILQISCNPYSAILGPPESATSRLNLSQGFNSIGTTISPIIIGYLVFSYLSDENVLKIPFVALGCLFLAAGLIVYKTDLPEYKQEEKINLKGSALQFKQMKLGMIAVFCYVGAEVAIGSKLIEYLELPSKGALSKGVAATYVGVYWGGAMIGRLTNAITSNPDKNLMKKVIQGSITILGLFLFLVLCISISNHINSETTQGYSLLTYENALIGLFPLVIFIGIQFATMLIFRNSSSRLLMVFALINAILLVLVYYFENINAVWCLVSIGLFNSIMWPNIFTLSISGLKEYTSQGSSLLIIMIIGGAIIPFVMGIISDNSDLKIAYLLPIICYIYIAYFGIFGNSNKTNLHE